MKLLFSLLSLFVSATATMVELKDIKASSKMGQALLSQARKLNNDKNEVDMTWIMDYSLKFQGCHSVSQWNAENDNRNDVKIQTKRLIRFRLCPTSTCSLTDAGGCGSGYGDYIIDMNTYLEAYFGTVEVINEYKCGEIAATCDCENAENAEYCEYDCYVAANMASCSDRNPYEEDNGNKNEQFNLNDYVGCARWEYKNNNRRQLNDKVEYFMGPYCASQGGAIFLGLFTDDTCSQFVDSTGGVETYLTTTGSEMPYGAQSIIGMDCISCIEPTEYNVNGDDAEDADQVNEACEAIYTVAGKCEQGLSVEAPNNNACTYIEGIKIIRQNGTVERGSASANKTASVFIGLFVTAFVLLAAYVYYLRTKLDRASINLSE